MRMGLLCDDMSCDNYHLKHDLRGISFEDFINNEQICDFYCEELELEEGQYPLRCKACLEGGPR